MITSFSGQHAFLSNFYLVVILVDQRYFYWYDEVHKFPEAYVGEISMQFSSVEHAYQALKAREVEHTFYIQNSTSPAQAKRRGKEIIIRPNWGKVKLELMEMLLRLKFTNELKDMLLDTGEEELVEDNWWGDTYWGVCKGEGQNNLGKLLMKIREELGNKIVESKIMEMIIGGD